MLPLDLRKDLSPREGNNLKHIPIWRDSGKATACSVCCLLPLPFCASIFPRALQRDRTLTWGSGMNCQDTASKSTNHSTSWHTSPFLDSASCPKDHTHHISEHEPTLCDSSPRALASTQCGIDSSVKASSTNRSAFQSQYQEQKGKILNNLSFVTCLLKTYCLLYNLMILSL